MTDTNAAQPYKPKMRPGEPEPTFRARAQYEAQQQREQERHEEAQREGEAKYQRERSMVRRITEKAKAALSFDKNTVGGTMAAMLHEPRIEGHLEYAKAAKKVAQAGDNAKQADKAALAKAALAIGYAPSRVEADLAKLRRYFDRKPKLDALIASTAQADRDLAAAVARHKAAEAELKAANEVKVNAANACNKAASAPSELQRLENECGDLFASRDQLLAKAAAEEARQAAEQRRHTPGVAYAI